ncbi:MAG: hypothetical protein JWM95_3675 [Gemmatimonadetes bacterium]|nr:hypothetical protein [Gemmatimonadota bacterium]
MPSFPRLLSPDPARAAQWYQDVLGFANVYSMADGRGGMLFSHLRWALFADLLIVREITLFPSPTEGIVLTFGASGPEELSALADRAAGWVTSGPAPTAWNTTEVQVRDLDGYRLTFTCAQADVMQPGGETFEEVMQRLRSDSGGT